MPDREKVIAWLNEIVNTLGSFTDDSEQEVCQLAKDTIALLKEQDAELSYREAKAITHTATKLDDPTCPSCGNVVRPVRYDYFHYCGQKLDWGRSVK